jgi:hypothetical protein
MSRLQLTVKETFGMSELQNYTVIVPPTYLTLNKWPKWTTAKKKLHVKFCS